MAKSGDLSQLRIIGGKFKGRKISFIPFAGLRPTPDRVRETLFNWLASAIVGAHCLDAFAGSGALSFEAISRGAAFVTMLEQSTLGISQLHTMVQQLGICNSEIIKADTLVYLPKLQRQYDIVFIDPPFHQALLLPMLSLLAHYEVLRPKAFIYIEAAIALAPHQIPPHWQCLKSRKAGQVYYSLYQKISAS